MLEPRIVATSVSRFVVTDGERGPGASVVRRAMSQSPAPHGDPAYRTGATAITHSDGSRGSSRSSPAGRCVETGPLSHDGSRRRLELPPAHQRDAGHDRYRADAGKHPEPEGESARRRL